jgi:hypothetical protein
MRVPRVEALGIYHGLVATFLRELIDRAARGTSEDVDFLLGHLTPDATLATTKFVDYALSLVENATGVRRIEQYLFVGTQMQRNYCSLVLQPERGLAHRQAGVRAGVDRRDPGVRSVTSALRRNPAIASVIVVASGMPWHRHHPEVTVEVFEGRRVAPVVDRALADDRAAAGTRTFDELVDVDGEREREVDDAFGHPWARDGVPAGDPAEPARRDQHQVDAVVEREHDGFRKLAVGSVHGVPESEALAVEARRGDEVAGREADGDERGEGHGWMYATQKMRVKDGWWVRVGVRGVLAGAATSSWRHCRGTTNPHDAP